MKYQFILHIIKQVRNLSIEDDCHQMNAVISVRRPWRETEHFSAATVSEITVSFVPLLSEQLVILNIVNNFAKILKLPLSVYSTT